MKTLIASAMVLAMIDSDLEKGFKTLRGHLRKYGPPWTHRQFGAPPEQPLALQVGLALGSVHVIWVTIRETGSIYSMPNIVELWGSAVPGGTPTLITTVGLGNMGRELSQNPAPYTVTCDLSSFPQGNVTLWVKFRNAYGTITSTLTTTGTNP